jgi:hypothetical protein
METVTALIRSIFNKESLDDCSLEELQAMARQYSYFTPVQLLLAEKLKATDETLYQEQLQKLSLHFNNPLWLDCLLTSYKTEELATQITSQISETTKEEIIESTRENNSPGTMEVVDQQEIREPMIHEEELHPSSESFELVDEEIPEPTARNEEQAEQLPGEPNINTQLETAGSPGEETNEAPTPLPLPDLNQEPAETELSFQPYHTVDYFASQGIKFIPEEKPTDRFGRQLKSFTEWLKTMKRLPQTEIPKIADIASEKKVEQMAEHSIDQGDVITETMAEVWIKQGNMEKAIETYNKLSLLNPDKSAYFASLAEQLKNS